MELYLGDCLEVMKQIEDKSIDMILCDLPYAQTGLKWDKLLPMNDLWQQYKRIIKDNGAILLFGQEPFSSFLRISNIKWYKYDIYWQKERQTNILQLKRRMGKVIETISVFYNKQCTYNPQMTKCDKIRKNTVKNGSLGKLIDGQNKKAFVYNDDGLRYSIQLQKFKRDILTSNLHPTQKPLELCKYLIKTYTNEGDLVLDNCMGSGTTCLAAKELNRRYIGIEKDEKYFNIAKERIEGE